METRHVYVVVNDEFPTGDPSLNPDPSEDYRPERTEIKFSGVFAEMMAIHYHYVRQVVYCQDRGPRIGDEGVAICVKEAGHEGNHRAHESWSPYPQNVPQW